MDASNLTAPGHLARIWLSSARSCLPHWTLAALSLTTTWACRPRRHRYGQHSPPNCRGHATDASCRAGGASSHWQERMADPDITILCSKCNGECSNMHLTKVAGPCGHIFSRRLRRHLPPLLPPFAAHLDSYPRSWQSAYKQKTFSERCLGLPFQFFTKRQQGRMWMLGECFHNGI